jgi:hypothetical protein
MNDQEHFRVHRAVPRNQHCLGGRLDGQEGCSRQDLKSREGEEGEEYNWDHWD